MQRARSSLSESVSVYRFLDAREFLRAAYQQAKRIDPAFSHRYIARTLRVTSSSFFPQLLAGKSRLTRARALAFARLFGLTAPETAYFEELVAYTESVDPREKERALEKLKAADPHRRHALLEAFQAEYFRKWQYAAVRELLALHPFRGDYAALGKMLDPPLTAAAAREAVDLLLRLKLVRKTPHGGCEPTERIVLSGPKIPPEQVRPALEGISTSPVARSRSIPPRRGPSPTRR
jgi:uncharacterized protein (TIGR02147 family)